jgi:hypothetical protein
VEFKELPAGIVFGELPGTPAGEEPSGPASAIIACAKRTMPSTLHAYVLKPHRVGRFHMNGIDVTEGNPKICPEPLYSLPRPLVPLVTVVNDSTSPAMDQSRPEPSSPVQVQSKKFFGLGSDRSQMLTDWTGLGPDRSLTVSRVRVYFPGY